MKIAVLGWGSLIWDSRNLQSDGKWKIDGPFLPIEFARISNNSRLTLVIKQNANPVQVLWSYMTIDDLNLARENLKEREDTTNINRIGFVNLIDNSSSSKYNGILEIINKWASHKNIDAVIWTDLGVKFKDKINKELNIKNIIDYLRSLPKEKQNLAKEYIINAHQQIRTEYRMGIENKLNWKK